MSPRGNDPDAARELQERYGTPGNAEELITANRARRDRVVAAASRTAYDEEATKDLKLSEIDAPGDVVDAAVRGDYVSYVWEDESGRLHHGAQPRKGAPKARLVDPEPTADERALRDAAERDAELARIREDAERRVAEAQAKAQEQAAKDAQKQAQKAERADKADSS